jgi:hypothetical protein
MPAQAIDAMLRGTPNMQLLSLYLDLGKPVVALQAPPPDRRRTPYLRPDSRGSSRWAAGGTIPA